MDTRSLYCLALVTSKKPEPKRWEPHDTHHHKPLLKTVIATSCLADDVDSASAFGHALLEKDRPASAGWIHEVVASKITLELTSAQRKAYDNNSPTN